jgi:WD40 repeat protein/serine/threonine protein kinase
MPFLFTCPAGHRWQATPQDDLGQMRAVRCPQCGQAAGIIWQDVTDGPSASAVSLSGGATVLDQTGPFLPSNASATVDLAHPPGKASGTVDLANPPLAVPADWPVLPGYQILSELGRGGMGVVYKARQVRLNRLVALKTIRAGAHAGSAERERFQAEALVVAQLHHPNIVQIYEVGSLPGSNPQPYFVLEYVDGGGLDRFLARKPQPSRLAAELVETLAKAMHCAHQAGIVHRDLKPGNVLLSGEVSGTEGHGSAAGPSRQPARSTVQGATSTVGSTPRTQSGPSAVLFPKITDFGLAKRLDDDLGRTRQGAILGTPSYMAPEQANGQLQWIGPATDVYGLGAILYEAITGRPPFREATQLDTLQCVRWQDPLPPSRLQPGCPRDLETICLKCLQKDPRRRYASAQELAVDLQRFRNNEPIRARPTPLWEHGWKWVRRQPVLAALLLVMVLSILAGFASVSRALEQTRTEERVLRAETENKKKQSREEEESGQQLIEETNRRIQQTRQAEEERRAEVHSIYATRIITASEEMTGNPVRALEFLDHCPQGERGWEWYHLKRTMHAEQLLLHGALMAEFSPDPWMPRLAVLSHFFTARLYDAAPPPINLASTGLPPTPPLLQELLPAANKAYSVACLAYGKDGALIALGGTTGMVGEAYRANLPGLVLIWDVSNRTIVHRLQGHRLNVYRVAYSADGRYLASLSGDGMYKLWDAVAGKELFSHPSGVTGRMSMTLSPDGRWLAAEGPNNTILLREVPSGKLVHTFQMNQRSTALRFSPDGKTLVAGTFSGVTICDVEKRQLVRSFLTQKAWVMALAFSKDGQRLAAGADDFTIRVFDVATGKNSVSLRGHLGTIRGLSFAPDGRLASTADDRAVRVWEPTQRQEARALAKIEGQVTALTLCPDDGTGRGRRLAVADNHGRVKLFDPSSGKELLSFQACGHWARAVVCSPDGRRLAVGGMKVVPEAERADKKDPDAGWQSQVRVFDAASGTQIFDLPVTGEDIDSLEYSPDGKFLASASRKESRLFDARTGRLLHTFKNTGRCLAFSPDSHELATVSMGKYRESVTADVGEVHLWDVETGRPLRTLIAQDKMFARVAYSADGRWLAASGAETLQKGNLHIWDRATGKQVQRVAGQEGGIFACQFSPDGKRIFTAGTDMRINIIDVQTGRLLLALEGAEAIVTALVMSPDGALLYSGDANGFIRVWNGTPTAMEMILHTHTDNYHVACSHDGRSLAASGIDGTVTLWSEGEYHYSRLLQRHGERTMETAFSPDDQRLATIDGRGEVRVWKIDDGTLLWSQRVEAGGGREIGWTADGKRLITLFVDKTVCVWEADTGKEVHRYRKHTSWLTALAVHPTKRWAATAGGDKVIRIWDVDTGEDRLVLPLDSAAINCLDFAPDGKKLLVGCGDGVVKVLDASTGKESLSFQGSRWAIFKARFRPDGRSFATGGPESVIRLHDVGTGRVLREFWPVAKEVSGMAFTHDGRTLVSADGAVRLWPVGP